MRENLLSSIKINVMEFVHSDEEELQKDIKERDSFANRLKARDESKTRKIAMPSGSGAGKLQRKYLISLPLVIIQQESYIYYVIYKLILQREKNF